MTRINQSVLNKRPLDKWVNAFGIISLITFSTNVYALPTGNELVAGQATVATPTANQMQINQTSDRAVLNW